MRESTYKILKEMKEYFYLDRYKISFMLPNGSILKGDPVYRCNKCGNTFGE